jgi:ribosome biogenesis GTPase
MDLKQIGWDSYFEEHFSQLPSHLIPARISCQRKQNYQILTEKGEFTAKISGSIRYKAKNKSMFPAIGDWVAVELREQEKTARICHILPRKTKFSRKVILSATDEQVIAANIDYIFIITSLESERDFNLRRIERYLALTNESKAAPVLIFNKMDLCSTEYVEEKLNLVTKEVILDLDIPIYSISAKKSLGIENQHEYFSKGKTVAFLGSSGVGKSELINSVLGKQISLTGEVREFDSVGRHTTTHRELFSIPNGGALIDTPGMRELQLWTDEKSLKESFKEISSLEPYCKFTNCTHTNEPGCQVLEALDNDELSAERYEHYQKLREEIKILNEKKEAVEKAKEKKFHPKRKHWDRKNTQKNWKFR